MLDVLSVLAEKNIALQTIQLNICEEDGSLSEISMAAFWRQDGESPQRTLILIKEGSAMEAHVNNSRKDTLLGKK